MRYTATAILAAMMLAGATATRSEAGSMQWVGRTYRYVSETVHEGNTVRTTGQVENDLGVVRTYDGRTVFEPNTATHHHEVTNGRGHTLRTNDTTVRRVDTNTLRRDTTVTGRHNGTFDVDVTHTRNGNAVNTVKTASVTTADGKTHVFNYNGRVAWKDKTIARDGKWTNGDGKTLGTVEAYYTREPNKGTYHKEVKNAAGQTVRLRDQTTARSGNTVTREGTLQARLFDKTYDHKAVRNGNTVTRSGSATVTPRSAKTASGQVRPAWLPKYRSTADASGARARSARPAVSRPRTPAPVLPTWRRSGASPSRSAARPRVTLPKVTMPKVRMPKIRMPKPRRKK